MSSLRECFDMAEEQRNKFLQSGQLENLSRSIASFQDARRLTQDLALFSRNESFDDVSSKEIRYFLIDFHLGSLIQQQFATVDRSKVLEQCLLLFHSFLQLCDDYDIVPVQEKKIVEQILSNETGQEAFRVQLNSQDQRQEKILRYKREKKLQSSLDRISGARNIDDGQLRECGVITIHLAISKSLQELESLRKESKILEAIRKDTPSGDYHESDALQKDQAQSEAWRLESNSSQILDHTGKVLKSFVITNGREQLSRSVFRADHSLPTMSIDEYLDLERARGGILDPGASRGDQTNISDFTNEDDEAAQDLERRKAIDWDKFTEENPKGIGNTMNRG